ncbi:unnamed protein product [Rotaria sordida]|uniref:Uncharacterized protein n=1 Tax=Rotaria sordida TaxID=392033 RepID=A0A819LTM6_9BILA|nr:unnamed protein product [Rotaria sordida]
MASFNSFESHDESMEKPNSESPIVIINVSGRRYETQLSTLENFPETLLGNESFATNKSYLQTDLKTTTAINILLLIRLFRILKLFLIFKYVKTLHTLGSTIKESCADFIGAFFGIILLAFLFGAACYVAEVEDNHAVFSSIPKALYWAIITIMTVGYGDMYPITTAGRIIACACALCGAAVIGMLVSVLVDRYQHIFNRKTYEPYQQMSSIEFTDTNNKSEDEEPYITQQFFSNTQLPIEQTIQRILNYKNHTNFDQEELLQTSLESNPNFIVLSNNSTINGQTVNQVIWDLNKNL